MALMADAAAAKGWGVFSWTYNRANFKYDSQQQWARFTAGRKFAIAQTNMFRDDINDLTQVAVRKLKTYGPLITMCIGNVVTCFVQGRSGLKLPGPPVFLSGVYYECLAIGFSFMVLALWFVFHSALRAQVCAVSLRTRKIRVPVPTQRQLDRARKLLSSFEEQNVYDQLKMPFVMPNRASTPVDSEEEEEDDKAGKMSCFSPTKPLKGKSSSSKASASSAAVTAAANTKVPGITQGHPGWIEHELEQRQKLPKASPSGYGLDGPTEPYEHFEHIRTAQKEWWCAEAYMRVCFLYGMMHLAHAFAYWLVIHTIAEQGAVWCGNICAAALTAAVWIMFRLDVLPDFGGCLPVEAAGPFVASVALALMYSRTEPSPAMLDFAQAVAILIVIMHLAWTFRLYAVAHPIHAPPSASREAGGRLFNEHGACDKPSWLPAAFQHVTYLVAPPKCQAQLDEEERRQQEGGENALDDPLTDVDMTPWYHTRTLLLMAGIGWSLLLTGRVVDLILGERMLVTNPGAPPWTRAGMWDGWEDGPVTSKKHAHVAPVRGHFAWEPGWGPQGQQRVWPSPNFGYSVEADAYWSEAGPGPEPHTGIAGEGENSWARGPVAYGEALPVQARGRALSAGFLARGEGESLFLAGGSHAVAPAPAKAAVARPCSVAWPPLLEPALLLADPASSASPLLAVAAGGAGALLADAARPDDAPAAPLALAGLLSLGAARGLARASDGHLLVVTSSGAVAVCRPTAVGAATASSSWAPGVWACETLQLPLLPEGLSAATALVPADGSAALRAALAQGPGRLALLELAGGAVPDWHEVGQLRLPEGAAAVASLTSGPEHLLAMTADGTTYRWALDGQGRPTGLPEVQAAPEPRREWLAAAALPGGRVARLAAEGAALYL